jgi:hypothetical protein
MLQFNRTISYALRRFSGCITKRNAQQLTGELYVNMPALKGEIMEMADAIEGRGRDIRTAVPVVFSEVVGADGGHQLGRLECDADGVLLYLDGYSQKTAGDHNGYLLALELYKGKPMLRVWGDINQEEPTHTIDLSGAAQSLRNDNGRES